MEYEYHTIYVKGLGSVSIGHNDKIEDVRKEIRKEFFNEVVSLYVWLGIMVIGVVSAVLYFHLLEPIK